MPTSFDDCDFCAIVRGEQSGVRLVDEGDDWIALFPLKPATPGHTLVIPRLHVEDLWQAPQNLAGTLTAAAVRVGRAIAHALSPDGMNLITSSGSAAEQTVFHLHLHVVPRWVDDGFGSIWPPARTTPAEVQDDVLESVRDALGK